MTTFVRGEIQRRIKYGFGILLSMADSVRLFVNKLNLSRIVVVPQAHFRPRMILNLSAKPDVGTPSFNDTTNKEAAT